MATMADLKTPGRDEDQDPTLRAYPTSAYTPPAGASAPGTSVNAPRLVQEGDTWVLTEHGNRRPLQPNEVPAAQQYVTDFWKAFPTGFQPGVGPQQNDQYSVAAGTTPRPNLSRGGLGGQNLQWSGFNFGRTQDPSKSAKDTFAHYGSLATWMPKTKADAERWFNEWIAPGLKSEGYTVHWVRGDKAFVSTRENPQGEEIDFLIGADGSNPQLGWQSNMADLVTAPPPTTTVPPPAPPAAPTTSTVTPSPTPTTGGGGTSPNQETADIQASQTTAPSVAPAALAERAAPFFAEQGVRVLEVRGNRMRILTAEDQAAGNTYGTWVEVGPASMPAMRTLAR